jgi:hypothetical protein
VAGMTDRTKLGMLLGQPTSLLRSSRHPGGVFPEPVMDEPPYYYLLTTYISYLILIEPPQGTEAGRVW